MSCPLLTIVVTALNEENNVGAVAANTLAAFDEFHCNGELILIDDGSSDRTTQICRDLAASEPRVSMVRHEMPEGVGASFWEGAQRARGEFVCWLPGDNENDPRETLRYAPLLEQVDIVLPFVFNKQVRSKSRNFISGLYRFIINSTFGLSLNYTNGTNVYRKSLLDALPVRTSGSFYHTDIVVRSVKQGYLFAEVPCRLWPRSHGKSKALTLRSFIKVARAYLRLVHDVYFDRRRKLPPLVADSRSAMRYRECELPPAKQDRAPQDAILGKKQESR